MLRLHALKICFCFMPRRNQPTTPGHSTESDALVAAVERLADELRILRDVIGEVREDISWVSRNGLPVQPIEHVVVKRMAKDPFAADWGDQLETIHLQSPQRTTNVDHDVIQKLTDGLRSAFEGIAQGQLEIVLTALDGVRTETLAVIGSHPCHAPSPEVPPPEPAGHMAPSDDDTASGKHVKPRRGQLF